MQNASKARKAIEKLRRGRKCELMSEHTKAAADLCLANAIANVANSLPRRRQVTALSSLREIANNIKQVLANLETPTAWSVSRPYASIDAENRGLEKSLLENEAHRHELLRVEKSAKAHLKEEQEALTGVKEDNVELQGESREDPEMHPLLIRPAKRVKVSGAIFGDDDGSMELAASGAMPALEGTGELQALKRAVSQQLTALEGPSSAGLPALELLGRVRDSLVAKLSG